MSSNPTGEYLPPLDGQHGQPQQYQLQQQYTQNGSYQMMQHHQQQPVVHQNAAQHHIHHHHQQHVPGTHPVTPGGVMPGVKQEQQQHTPQQHMGQQTPMQEMHHQEIPMPTPVVTQDAASAIANTPMSPEASNMASGDDDASSHNDDSGSGQPANKKQRRRYDNNFKAEVLNHLKIPGTKLSAIAKQYGIPENTLREWTKVSVVQSIEAARQKHGGTLKANMYDPMHKLTKRLMQFFQRNDMEPPNLKQPVTTKLVVQKGLEVRDAILTEDAQNPTLDSKERKALQNFTGSDSWAKKFAKRHDLKMTGARVKELGEDDVREFSSQLRQIATRVKQAGPGYDEVASMLRQAADKLVTAKIIVTRAAGKTPV